MPGTDWWVFIQKSSWPLGKTHDSPITPTPRHINFQHGFMMPHLSSHLIFLPWYTGEQLIYHRCLLINLIHECESTLLCGPIVGSSNLINTFGVIGINQALSCIVIDQRRELICKSYKISKWKLPFILHNYMDLPGLYITEPKMVSLHCVCVYV